MELFSIRIRRTFQLVSTRNGKLNGSYRVESTWEGKPYITIEGQYTDGEKSGQWIQHNYQDNTQTCTWHGEGGA